MNGLSSIVVSLANLCLGAFLSLLFVVLVGTLVVGLVTVIRIVREEIAHDDD